MWRFAKNKPLLIKNVGKPEYGQVWFSRKTELVEVSCNRTSLSKRGMTVIRSHSVAIIILNFKR